MNLFFSKRKNSRAPDLRLSEEMSHFLNESILGLSESQRKRFDSYVLDCCYDRGWCSDHNISYANPPVDLVRYFAIQDRLRLHF